MFAILSITTPIFLVIAIGYFSARFDYFPPQHLPAVGTFVVRIALPALLFKSLSERSFVEVMNFPYLAAYAGGSLVVLFLALIWSLLVRKQQLPAAAFAAMSASCPNSAFIGFPLAYGIVGPTATVALALSMIVENLILLPLCLALADSGSDIGGAGFVRSFANALRNLPKNPIVVAIVLAFIFATFELQLPTVLMSGVNLLASATAASALFFIGGTLATIHAQSIFGKVVWVTSFKLVLHPLSVLGALFLFGPVDPDLSMAAVLIASAPMMSILPILAQRHGLQAVSAAALLVSTLTSFVTITLFVWAVQQLPLLRYPW